MGITVKLSYASLKYLYFSGFIKPFFLIVLVAVIGTKLCEDSRRYGSGIHVQVATH